MGKVGVFMQDFIQIAMLVAPHGIKGEARAIMLTDFPQRFKKLKEGYLVKEQERLKVNIMYSDTRGKFVILKFAGFDTPEAIENYRNYFLEIDRNDAVKLPKGHYYIHEIIGLEVFDNTENYLGKVIDVLQTGANDVYVVQREDSVKKTGNKDLLIPAIKEVVREINIESKKMYVRLIEGLNDL
jgi:16S rRNA processing protein RimM